MIFNTFSGRDVDFSSLETQGHKFVIQDIAHGLSNICRFSGQASRFYSVGHHCLVLSSLFGDPKLRLAALLHDASEAYMGDVPTPVKVQIPEYSRMEYVILSQVAKRNLLPWPFPDIIWKKDSELGCVEAQNLFYIIPAWAKGAYFDLPAIFYEALTSDQVAKMYLDTYFSCVQDIMRKV